MAAEKKIAGAVYRFEPLVGWEAFDALNLLAKVADKIAPIMEALSESDDAKRTAKLLGAVTKSLGDVTSSDLKELISMLMASTTVNVNSAYMPAQVGVKPASLDDLLQVSVFILEAQFADFFGGAGVKQVATTLANFMAAPKADLDA